MTSNTHSCFLPEVTEPCGPRTDGVGGFWEQKFPEEMGGVCSLESLADCQLHNISQGLLDDDDDVDDDDDDEGNDYNDSGNDHNDGDTENAAANNPISCWKTTWINIFPGSHSAASR